VVRPPFPGEKARLIGAPHGEWEVDSFLPIAAMKARNPEVSDRGAIMMARLSIQQSYEQARQAAADAREWVVRCESLSTLTRDPVALAEALRDLDPRCLARDRQHEAGDLLWRLIEGPAPTETELRKAVQALTTMRQGRRPDLFVDAFVRALARWWLAVTGEIPP
jgi:hypothetical protein